MNVESLQQTAMFDSFPCAVYMCDSEGQVTYFNQDQPTSRVHSWNFTLEKEMLPQTVVRIGYVGIHGTHDDETYPVAQPSLWIPLKIPILK